jgi:hypothetical protein
MPLPACYNHEQKVAGSLDPSAKRCKAENKQKQRTEKEQKTQKVENTKSREHKKTENNKGENKKKLRGQVSSPEEVFLSK